MNLWQWTESQGIPGFVIGGWIGAIPFVKIWHKVSERRHKEALAQDRHFNNQVLLALHAPTISKDEKSDG